MIVLFVCLGNICRSPMAEAMFKQMVDDAGLNGKINVDSAGTSNEEEEMVPTQVPQRDNARTRVINGWLNLTPNYTTRLRVG